MRIGIDLDDTVCCTTEIVSELLEKYADWKKMNVLDIVNDEELKYKFFMDNLENIYKNVLIKNNCYHVLKRLRSRGNEIYVITAREEVEVSNGKTTLDITREWLNKEKIVVDGIFMGSYGEKKADICKEKNIDLMIDDDPFNCKLIMASGVNCLLFDDHERYSLDKNYVTTWEEVEKYIENNR